MKKVNRLVRLLFIYIKHIFTGRLHLFTRFFQKKRSKNWILRRIEPDKVKRTCNDNSEQTKSASRALGRAKDNFCESIFLINIVL